MNLLPRSGLLFLSADCADPRHFARSPGVGSRHSGCRRRPWRPTTCVRGRRVRRSPFARAASLTANWRYHRWGVHNVSNALAAVAIAAHAGLAPERICRRVSRQFRGRQAATRGCRVLAGGVTVYDDFAHHPTAIAGTLGCLCSRKIPIARIWAVLLATLRFLLPAGSSRR